MKDFCPIILAALFAFGCAPQTNDPSLSSRDVTVKISVKNKADTDPNAEVRVSFSKGPSPQVAQTGASGLAALVFPSVPPEEVEVQAIASIPGSINKRQGFVAKKLQPSDKFLEIEIPLQEAGTATNSNGGPSTELASASSQNGSIPLGASLDKGQRQEIRLLKITEIRNIPQGLWFAGPGSAIVNGGGGFYFWHSTTPPQIEVEASHLSPDCERLLKQGLPDGKAVAIVGNGSFQGTQINGTMLGKFTLLNVDACELVDPGSSPLNR